MLFANMLYIINKRHSLREPSKRLSCLHTAFLSVIYDHFGICALPLTEVTVSRLKSKLHLSTLETRQGERNEITNTSVFNQSSHTVSGTVAAGLGQANTTAVFMCKFSLIK